MGGRQRKKRGAKESEQKNDLSTQNEIVDSMHCCHKI